MNTIFLIAVLLISPFEVASTFADWLSLQVLKFDNFKEDFDERREGVKGYEQVLSGKPLRTSERDGVLLVRGLVNGNALKAIMREIEKVDKGEKRLSNHYRSSNAIKDVALFSDVPKAAAQLIHKQSKNSEKGPIRLLKDVMLSWPVEDETTGVNVWIALSLSHVSKYQFYVE